MKKSKVTKEELEPFVKLVHKVNKHIIEFSGGSLGSVNKGNLAFELWRSLRLAKKYRTDFYEIWAATVLEGIAQHHPFTDGNKRTAYVLCKLILLTGDKDFEVEYDKAESYIIKIARKKVPTNEVRNWVKKHAIPDGKHISPEIESFIRLLRKIIKND